MAARPRNVATVHTVRHTRKVVLPDGTGVANFARKLNRSGWLEVSTGEMIRNDAIIMFEVDRRPVEDGKEHSL